MAPRSRRRPRYWYRRPEIMLIKHSRSQQNVAIMDPDCAICSSPALAQCECEAKGLDLAVRQAEQRMMTGIFGDIRTWVRGHAQDYILSYFSVLTTRRKDQHYQHLARLHERSYYHGLRPHPSELAAADLELKRGIDEDWRTSVQRYPEVLEYFYGLVDLNLPDESAHEVRDPPLSALGGGGRREAKVRVRVVEERVREVSRVRERERERSRTRDREFGDEVVEERRRRRRSAGERDRDLVRERERERERIERERDRERERERERDRERARFEGPPVQNMGASRARSGGGPGYPPMMGPGGGYGYVQAPGY